MAERDKRRVIAEIQPTVAIEKTEAKRDLWVASGTVSLEIKRGDDSVVGTLAFPFRDAESRDQAILQAAAQLDAVVTELTKLADGLRPTQQEQVAAVDTPLDAAAGASA